MTKPVILGMNPSKDCSPLDPNIPNGSGERLYEMASSVTGWTREEYLEKFCLINVIDILKWNRAVARQRRKAVMEKISKSPSVIVLGRETWKILGLPSRAWFENSGKFFLVPHPSGRNTIYNDPDARQRTGLLLKWITS